MPDPKIIRGHITRLMAAHAGAAGCCGQPCDAFGQAYTERNASAAAAADENLAAAEHYLLSRCYVCSGRVSATGMRAMILGYNALKLIPGIARFMRHDPSKPTTPVSREAVAFALQGVTDGEAARQRCNASSDPPYLDRETIEGYNERSSPYSGSGYY